MSSYHQEVANVSNQVKAFFEKTFSEVSLHGPKLPVEEINKAPLMLVCTHRSHVDYFLAGSYFHLMGFKNLRFAAGDNLTNLPWIGKKFKAFGAFAIERDTGFDRNYVKNLCNSVVSMIEQGDTVLVFPEGGRSYSGAMLDMRIGVLGASVISQANMPDQDVHYIPIAISYEHAPDVPWFSMQQQGKKMRRHSNPFYVRFFGNLLYYGADILSFLPFLLFPKIKNRYGKVYIDYGYPVSIRSLIDVAANKSEKARDTFSAHKESMLKVSGVIFEQLHKLYRILPMHLVAEYLKTKGNCAISDITSALPELIEKLENQHRNIEQIKGYTVEDIVKEGCAQLQSIGALHMKKKRCTIKKPHLIQYYAAAQS